MTDFAIQGNTLLSWRKGDIKIPYGIQVIGDHAFYKCYWLTSVCMPEGVKEIQHAAFKKCPRLKKIMLPYSIETIGDGNFADIDRVSLSKVPLEISKNIASIQKLQAEWRKQDSVIFDFGGTCIYILRREIVRNCGLCLTFNSTSQDILFKYAVKLIEAGDKKELEKFLNFNLLSVDIIEKLITERTIALPPVVFKLLKDSLKFKKMYNSSRAIPENA